MYSIVTPPIPVALRQVPLWLPELLGHVQAGFPSPAEDLGESDIDLVKQLITHPQATYLLRARGTSMIEAGIFDNDILIVNKALKPRHQDVVVAVVDGEFTVKHLYQRAGQIKLKAANRTFPDITPKDGQTIEVWGVVTSTIKQFRY
jgi:DNA polymerase V